MADFSTNIVYVNANMIAGIDHTRWFIFHPFVTEYQPMYRILIFFEFSGNCVLSKYYNYLITNKLLGFDTYYLF